MDNLRKVFAIVLSVMVLSFIFFAMFPMILRGVDVVNGTNNITEYTGLVDLNHLAPLLIMVGGIGAIIFMVWWGFVKNRRH